jgi:hypothetical protein
MPLETPQAIAVRTYATQPTEADRPVIARLRLAAEPEPVAFLVTVELAAVPPATSRGWALYVDDFRIPKYWQYRLGIYFKIYDAQFFADHAGGRLRFTADRTDFVETGLTLDGPAPESFADRSALPTQDEILNPPA